MSPGISWGGQGTKVAQGTRGMFSERGVRGVRGMRSTRGVRAVVPVVYVRGVRGRRGGRGLEGRHAVRRKCSPWR